MSLERTLVIIKPDAMKLNLFIGIIKEFERHGLAPFYYAPMRISAAQCAEFYGHVKAQLPDVYAKVEMYITGGVSLALIIEGNNVITRARELRGPADIMQAKRGTIRRDFMTRQERFDYAYRGSVKNLLHASGSREEAEREIAILFETA